MNRDDIFVVIKKHTANCLESDPEQIQITDSLEQLGATSLDMVEIISLSMRELKVKIPRNELQDLRNIEAVVDRFAASMSEKV